jgi:hypothetical protein
LHSRQTSLIVKQVNYWATCFGDRALEARISIDGISGHPSSDHPYVEIRLGNGSADRHELTFSPAELLMRDESGYTHLLETHSYTDCTSCRNKCQIDPEPNWIEAGGNSVVHFASCYGLGFWPDGSDYAEVVTPPTVLTIDGFPTSGGPPNAPCSAYAEFLRSDAPLCH